MRKPTALMSVLGLTLLGTPAMSADPPSLSLEGVAAGSLVFPSGTECQNYEGQNVRTDGHATGLSTVLGETTLMTTHCAPEGPDIAGKATLVSADGDEVHLEYVGANAPPDPDTGVLVSLTDFTIVGGTGRFEGAEGEGTLTAYVLFEGFEDPEWVADWAWEGSISY